MKLLKDWKERQGILYCATAGLEYTWLSAEGGGTTDKDFSCNHSPYVKHHGNYFKTNELRTTISL